MWEFVDQMTRTPDAFRRGSASPGAVRPSAFVRRVCTRDSSMTCSPTWRRSAAAGPQLHARRDVGSPDPPRYREGPMSPDPHPLRPGREPLQRPRAPGARRRPDRSWSPAAPATSAACSCRGCSSGGYRVRVLDRLYFGEDSLGAVREKIEVVGRRRARHPGDGARRHRRRHQPQRAEQRPTRRVRSRGELGR